MNDIVLSRVGTATLGSRQADETRPTNEDRLRTTIFLGPTDFAICQKITESLGIYGVENRSRAIRYALRYWEEQNT